MSQKEKIAEELGVEVEDICTKCEMDEIYDTEICITCLEAKLSGDEEEED